MLVELWFNLRLAHLQVAMNTLSSLPHRRQKRGSLSWLARRHSRFVPRFCGEFRVCDPAKEHQQLKNSLKSLRAALLHLSVDVQLALFSKRLSVVDLPFRAELFSADQMERHGKTLADAHVLREDRGGDQLLTRLTDNERVLDTASSLLTQAVKDSRRITPAGEWLLDNLYLIEEQILTARAHFPKGYSRELPVLKNGSSKGLPRVYDIALEVISHGDGRVDPENLIRFVGAYQKVSTLKLGELWAIPIMLRLALIENLRRIGARVAEGMADRNRANDWADKMIDVWLTTITLAGWS